VKGGGAGGEEAEEEEEEEEEEEGPVNVDRAWVAHAGRRVGLGRGGSCGCLTAFCIRWSGRFAVLSQLAVIGAPAGMVQGGPKLGVSSAG
jgi:hypothetical protein